MISTCPFCSPTKDDRTTLAEETKSGASGQDNPPPGSAESNTTKDLPLHGTEELESLVSALHVSLSGFYISPARGPNHLLSPRCIQWSPHKLLWSASFVVWLTVFQIYLKRLRVHALVTTIMLVWWTGCYEGMDQRRNIWTQRVIEWCKRVTNKDVSLVTR